MFSTNLDMTTSGFVKTSFISVFVFAHKGGMSSKTSFLRKAPWNREKTHPGLRSFASLTSPLCFTRTTLWFWEFSVSPFDSVLWTHQCTDCTPASQNKIGNMSVELYMNQTKQQRQESNQDVHLEVGQNSRNSFHLLFLSSMVGDFEVVNQISLNLIVLCWKIDQHCCSCGKRQNHAKKKMWWRTTQGLTRYSVPCFVEPATEQQNSHEFLFWWIYICCPSHTGGTEFCGSTACNCRVEVTYCPPDGSSCEMRYNFWIMSAASWI